MRCEERRLLTADGTPLFYRVAQNDNYTHKGTAVLIHGMGEHGGRYLEFAEHLCQSGFSCLIPDLRGFGKSGGIRTHADKFEDFLDDLRLILRHSETFLPESKKALFFVGHSFGGLIAASLLSRAPIAAARGLVLSSPLFGIAVRVPTPLRLAAILASRLAPTLHQPNRVNTRALTHDEKVMRAYGNDPLIDHRISVRLYAEILKQLSAVDRMASTLKIPTLILQAAEDLVVSKPATVRFFDTLSSPDKTFWLMDGLYHEVLQETSRLDSFKKIAVWMNSRLNFN